MTWSLNQCVECIALPSSYRSSVVIRVFLSWVECRLIDREIMSHSYDSHSNDSTRLMILIRVWHNDAYEWVNGNESRHTISMSHVTHMIESCQIDECATLHISMSHEWVNSYSTAMPDTCMSRVTRLNESCHTHGWVRSHIWMILVIDIWIRHVTHMNASCHTYEWGISHIWMCHVTYLSAVCHVTYLSAVCHTYDRIIPHIWMRHVSHTNVGSHAYE